MASGGSSKFECSICLDTATSPVVSLCGHLFCWPCIYRWMESGTAASQTCPVCKAQISRDSLIPLYGRGEEKGSDPRETIPERPAGRREEPPPQQQQQQFGGGAPGWNVSFGFGAPFLFPFFGVGFDNFGLHQQQQQRNYARMRPPQTLEQQRATTVSRVMLMLGFLALFLLMFTPI